MIRPHSSPFTFLDAPRAGLVRRVIRQNLLVLLVLCLPTVAAAASRPSFDRIVQALAFQFRSLDDFQRGDLLSQKQVADALAAVAKAGWEVPDADKIVQLALPENSFLVGELATPDGKRFMRKISQYSGTYSRLDRLSRLNQGQQVVTQLIGDAGGDTLITYLATTNGGHNLGQMLATTPNGTDLNEPTGRIYTADDLLGVLKKIYAQQSNSP